jgi:tripartite-type tricarboxylate transporter receptor subunit TctC
MKKLLSILLLVPVLAFAWAPEKGKPVTVIVGNVPGAGNEVSFRILAEIVEKNNPNFSYAILNLPGQDSAIANNKFLDIAPDGYTINLPSHMSSYVTNDIWQKTIMKYRWDSFTDILTMGKSPLVLVASVNSAVNTPVDFIHYLAKTTRPINIAVGGGAHRVAYEYLIEKAQANRDMVKPIKFNGPLPAVLSVAQYDSKTGTEFGIMPITIAQPLIQAGKVKPIGFTGTWVPHQYPTVPLLNSVAPGINVYAAWSIELPPNAPADIVAWYQREFSKAVRSKEYAAWREKNVVFYEESELTPAGLKKQMAYLRETFLPMLQKIDLSKE